MTKDSLSPYTMTTDIDSLNFGFPSSSNEHSKKNTFQNQLIKLIRTVPHSERTLQKIFILDFGNTNHPMKQKLNQRDRGHSDLSHYFLNGL